ncbi:MAG: TonB-dependent receptor [Candidatus Polarisedimenticolaceae bacterium]|nr:TonB-dependent receptor [Candidatus Polarisedimenticolaceae bacterium]
MLCSNVYAANGFPEDEFAEDDMLFDEEEILISATGYSKPARLAPSVATVITAAEIKEMGATTIFEALESVPGIHVYPNKDLLAPKLSIRGIHTNDGAQTLFLRNGQPIKNAAVSNVPGAYRAPISNIARIEVIRGPGSAVHGADALAGVINIVTKDAHEIGGIDLGGRMGSFNSNSAWVQYGKKYADWDVAFSLEQMRTGGDPDRMVNIDTADPALSYAPDHLETGYEYYETSLYLRNESWDIDFWHWQQRDGGTGPGIAHALDPMGNEDYQYYQFDISYTLRELLPDLELKPHFNYVYQDGQRNFVLLPPGSGGGAYPNGMIGNPGLEDRTYTANITGTYSGFEQHTLRIDLGYSRQELDTNESKNFDNSFAPMPFAEVADTGLVYIPDTDRERRFLSVQDEWHISKAWIFTGGLRYDHYNDFGKTINPRLALIWSPPMPLTTKLLYGSAFRAPSLQELYITRNPAIEGNDGLDPETIDTLELAFEYFPLLELNSRLSLFYYEMDDTIQVVSAQYQNTEGQRGYGFEFEAEWDMTNRLKLRSSLAWQHAETKDGGSRVPKAPGRELHFAANWEFTPGWTVDTQVNWIGGRKRPAGENRDKLDNFTIIDLTLRTMTHDRSWEFALSARNLFDKQAFEWGDSPTNAFGAVLGDYELQGRSVYAEMSYHFR